MSENITKEIEQINTDYQEFGIYLLLFILRIINFFSSGFAGTLTCNGSKYGVFSIDTALLLAPLFVIPFGRIGTVLKIITVNLISTYPHIINISNKHIREIIFSNL